MKNLLQDLNKAFDSRIRLAIMSVLMVNDSIDFGTLKDRLQITDGNLASHITALEKLDYLKVKKQFIGKRPNTSYVATARGRKAFASHLDALEKLISLNS